VNLSGKADSRANSVTHRWLRPPFALESSHSACPHLPPAPLLTTPLNALHIELGARMVPFAGYSMPVQYPAGLMAEHLHTRTAAGLFDVSHMGQLQAGRSRCRRRV
jgi:aminomethyltransferase